MRDSRREKWYGTEYTSSKIPEDFLSQIRDAFENPRRPAELHFPHKNQFIPTRLEVEKKEIAEPLKAPNIIRNDEGVRTWYKKDDQFWVPKANVNILFRTPMSAFSARTAVMGALYCEIVTDALVQYSYAACISGLAFDIDTNTSGLTMSVQGYNDKLHVLLEKALVSMRDLEIHEDRFKILHDRMTRQFRNAGYGKPFLQIRTYSRWLKADTGFLKEQLMEELKDVTAAEVQRYFPQLLAQCYIEVLAHGNLYKEEALKITDLAEKTLKPKRLPPSQWPVRRHLILPPGSNFIYERQLVDPANVNHCIEYMLYLGTSTDRDLRAKILLIAQMMGEPAFNQLRTIEQLGYVVFSGGTTIDTWAGYRIFIQSEKDCRYLEGRIEHFLTKFEKTLDKMSETEFEAHKKAAINKRLEKPKNLTEEGTRFWDHISSDAYDFLISKSLIPLVRFYLDANAF